MDKTNQLEKLYQEIFECKKCHPNVVASKVRRQVLGNTLNSKILLMAQAPGETGVRTSGVHWNRENGTLTKGGNFLDQQLALIKYSVNLRSDAIPRPYTTNVLQCWTGRAKGKRDRIPESKELTNCAKWWKKELEIIQPTLMILLGAPATEYFAKLIDKNWVFAEMLKHQGENVKIRDINLAFKVFFLPHPTAPYKELIEPYRKQKQLYQEVFQQVKEEMNRRLSIFK